MSVQPLDVAALVASIVEELAPVIHDKRVVVGARGAGPTSARADEHATRLILVNLLTNANKYAPAGTEIHVDVDGAEDRVCVVVSDEGPGISTDDAERVFEKFERASTSTKGYGLGLYLSRQLARQQGGDLVYDPATGGGAAFSLSLPLTGD